MKFDGQTFAVGTINPMTGTTPDTAAVKAALESTYPCLGITCAHVGGLLKNDNDLAGGYKTGMDPCSHKAYIAGYHPGSNVVQHNQIDLDQKAIEAAVADGASQDFAAAKSVYTSGGVNAANGGFNSMSKGKARTLQGFSTNAKARMMDITLGPYKTYKKFYDYYGDYDYADKWVLAALDGAEYVPANAGTTHAPGFKSTDLAARKEAVQKGTAYQNVWMYVIREFEDAIDDCKSCTSNCNEFSDSVGKTGQYNAVHAWDEGVAFYTGSLAGNTADAKRKGKMVFALAEKRCENFGTCHIRGGLSQVNTELFKLFAQGRDKLHYTGTSTCDEVRPILDDIIRLMTVPLVQGTLRYAWKVGTGSDGQPNKASDQTAKNHAEGATFAQALLPLVHHCDAAAAKVVSDNMKFDGQTFPTGGGITGTTPDTAAVKAALESTYSCLGISCAHVGGLLKDEAVPGEYHTGMGVCTDIVHSPPPPPSKLSTGKKITVKVKAAGAVSDYDDKKKAELESAMATVAGVSADAVTVTVTAGSVILDFEIITTDPEATKTTVTTALADTTKASAALGVTVEETPTVAVVAEKKDDDDGLSGGAIAGIIIGAVVGLLCIGGIIFFAMKSGKNVDPK